MATQKPRKNQFGALTGSKAHWTLHGPKGEAVTVKLVDRFSWKGIRFAIVAEVRRPVTPPKS